MRYEDDETMLISVVMPVYNAEKYIGQAIESVKKQTYHEWELIIVDDCSHDRSLEIAKAYEKIDSRIHVEQLEKNSGVAVARNYGIKKANGEYIALLDSDDIWVDDKLEKQLEIANLSKANIIYCSYDFIDENGCQIKKPFVVPENTNYNQMLVSSVISCSTVLIEADLLKKHLFRPEFYHEDYVLWMELLAVPGIKASGEKKVLAHYRQVSGSRSNNKWNAAKERWNTYRDALKLNFFKSAVVFVKYAINGVRKYR